MALPMRLSKLSGLVIDEVGSVRRPANQHGLTVIAKADEEQNMAIYDADGNEVDENELEHGDVVYDENDNEFIFVEDQGDEGNQGDQGDEGYEEGDEGQFAYEPEYAGVGKAFAGGFASSAAKQALTDTRASLGRGRAAAKVKATRAVGAAREGGRGARSGLAGQTALGESFGTSSGFRRGNAIGSHLSDKRVAYGAGAGAAAVGGTGFAVSRRQTKSASLGDIVLEQLSKALDENQHDEVIAQFADLLETVIQKNDELTETVEALLADRELDDYVDYAKSYEGLPVDAADLGSILQRVGSVLPPRDLATLDRVFKSAGAGMDDYDEIGYGGPGAPMGSEVLEQVYAIAGQAVGKSNSAITPEQAVTAIFAANPAAYDQYEAEKYQR
jgi:hypothetical protein